MNEARIYEPMRAFVQPQIEVGVVGWNDREEHFDKGDPSGGDGERHTLVFVTLFRGKDPTEKPGDGSAQGYQIMCRLSGGVFRIPAKGTPVFVAVPHNMETQPGAGVIIATLEDDRRHNLVHGDVVVQADKGAARAVVKADGSIALFTTDTNDDNGKSVYIRVAPDGMQFVAPWGTVKFDASGFHVLHSSGASFDLGGIYGMPAPLDQITSYVRMSAATINGRASAASFGVGTTDPVASSTAVMTAIAALQAQVTAMEAAWAALGAITGPIAGAAVAPISADVAASATTNAPAVADAVNPTTSLIPRTTSSS